MQRNKLIYALADAALVVSSDYEKGGTWAGAVEQLEKLQLVPVYVRAHGDTGKGLEALRRKGALPWPDPSTPETLDEALSVEIAAKQGAAGQDQLSFSVRQEPETAYEVATETPPILQSAASPLTPADELFDKVRELLKQTTTPKTDAEVADELHVSKSQAKEWLQRLVEEGVLVKLSRPTRYCSSASSGQLF